jgi:hypothetical protein
MTELLQKAIAVVNKLPPEQQDELAALILGELASEQHWASAFAASVGTLELLADEAFAEHGKGQSQALDPYRL